MRFLIETITGRKGYKSFKDLNEYIDFMTKKGHMVKNLTEADLPYTDKPVKLPKVSKSNGWSEVTDLGDIDREAEKADSLIASTSDSVMKDSAEMEVSKSSEAKDKPEMGLGGEKGDAEMADFKEFKYEEPEMKSSETKSEPAKEEAPKADSEPKEEKKEEPKEEKKEEPKEEPKEEKKGDEEESEEDKEIKESLRIAGVNLEEGIKDYLPRAGFIRDDDEDKESQKMGIWGGQGTDDQLRKAKIIAKVKFANGDRFGRVTREDLDNFEEYKRQYDEIYGSSDDYDNEIEECLKNAGM